MTPRVLESYSTLSLYSAIAVFTVAMVAFATGLAWRVRTASASATATDAAVAPRQDRPARSAADGIAYSLTWLAAAILAAAVLLRALAVMRVPWGNMFEFTTTGSLAVVLTFLVANLRWDLRWSGVFVVGPVLLALGMAVTVYYTAASQLLPSLRSYWLVIHVSVAILSVALFSLGAVMSLLFVLKSRSTRRSTGSRILAALPDTTTLEGTAYALHIVAFPLWTFTLVAGAIWAEQAWGAYWQWDPKEVWTFVIWVVYAAYLHARATSGWSREASALLALAGYVSILVNYMVVNVYFVGMHSYSGM
ncbi:c-type cytochrome biogenesis protein CcsB [Knoellia koreensis]|uniref:C-type cytochrome biogenesis protein CcsB n=1 Tax=Knoellia koreensis TaxID=2730921 RepID=A0A849HMV2_9MICO|nr:c-type cytochrome biogenesis protein CcsB [Knoellia sp. DB2414S]NNM47854.1 c-type cytochrome biogenesis protein CcsB [Knoellia sp. DB2414S]